jgi:hypothetical protein
MIEAGVRFLLLSATLRPVNKTARSFLASLALIAGSGLGLSACPETGSSKPPAACSKAYEKCTLPSGVLGICDTVDCSEGATPPCLVCRSQH